MGAHPYCYFTSYNPDIAAALDELREQEFRAGRYDPALQAANPPTFTFEQTFPPGPEFPSPGAQHASMMEAFEESEPDGTGSILDLFGIALEPEFVHCSPVPDADLISIFGSAQPMRADIETILPKRGPISPDALQRFGTFWDSIGRGEGRYIVVHGASGPEALFFAGYSLD
ncbi:MAG TPA: hypothetical protein VGO52_24780 [Hyphomonadaceae bacterium]|jgi:hypothetical protein|nr:hypothetical protein [Hyphomonadaceae bacterium]